MLVFSSLPVFGRLHAIFARVANAWRSPSERHCEDEEKRNEKGAIDLPIAQPGPEGIEAAETFLRACRDVRKAWYQTPLLARCNPKTVRDARSALADGNEQAIVSLMTEMAGPVARADPNAAFDGVAHAHLEFAGIIGRLLVGALLTGRRPGARLDPLAIRSALAGWIATGTLVSWCDAELGDSTDPEVRPVVTSLPDALSSQVCANASNAARAETLVKLAHLLLRGAKPAQLILWGEARRAEIEGSPKSPADALLATRRAATGRLRLVAPLASPVETLMVMHRLSDRFVDLLEASRANESQAQRVVDDWLRAHPDFMPEPPSKPSTARRRVAAEAGRPSQQIAPEIP